MSRGTITASACVVVAAAGGFLAGNRFGRTGATERPVQALDDQAGKPKIEARTQPGGSGQELRELRDPVARLRSDLSKAGAVGGISESTPDDRPPATGPSELHTTADAAKIVGNLGPDTSAKPFCCQPRNIGLVGRAA